MPRTIWSALRGSTPRRTASSTVSSNLAVARLFTRSTASRRGVELGRGRTDGSRRCTSFRASPWSAPSCRAARAAEVRRGCGGPAGRGRPGRGAARTVSGPGGSDDLDAHRAGGAGDLQLGGLEVVGVEVGHLDLGDLGDLRVGDRAGDGLRPGSGTPCRGRRPAGSAPSVGGVFRTKVNERSSKIGDLDRDDRAPLRLGLGVVLLAEVHDRHAVRAERRAHRRRRAWRRPAGIWILTTAETFFLAMSSARFSTRSTLPTERPWRDGPLVAARRRR